MTGDPLAIKRGNLYDIRKQISAALRDLQDQIDAGGGGGGGAGGGIFDCGFADTVYTDDDANIDCGSAT